MVGWLLPIRFGALFGFFLGMYVDNQLIANSREGRYRARYAGASGSSNADFITSLIVLTAFVMKADGKVTNSELDYVKAYYKRIFGLHGAQSYILRLRDILKRDIHPRTVMVHIQTINYSSRLQLLHFLFGIAHADGQYTQVEQDRLVEIANLLRLSQSDFDSIRSMFGTQQQQASEETWYAILGVSASSSNEEIKKAYRKKAIEYHPDKVANLGKEIQESAKEKFQALNEAYQKIRQQRNF